MIQDVGERLEQRASSRGYVDVCELIVKVSTQHGRLYVRESLTVLYFESYVFEEYR